MMILQFVVQFWLGSDMMEEVIRFSAGSSRIRPGQSPFENFPIGAFAAFYAITIGLSLIQYLIIQNLINGALAKAISRSYLSEPTSILEAYNFGVRRFFSLLGASLAPFGIVILFSGVLTACSIGLLTTLGVRAGERPNVGLIILAALGLIGALIGLGLVSLWIYTRLIATTQAIVLEGQGPLAGLGRSWELVRGSFWRVLGIMILMFALTYMVSAIPALVVNFSLQFLSGNALDSLMRNQAITSLVAYIGIIVSLPLKLAVYTLLYYDLRVRKEGYDMELMAQQQAAIA
jgi:hypothetical protein